MGILLDSTSYNRLDAFTVTKPTLQCTAGYFIQCIILTYLNNDKTFAVDLRMRDRWPCGTVVYRMYDACVVKELELAKHELFLKDQDLEMLRQKAECATQLKDQVSFT